mmetsp:Transcript_52519/g.111922  ORF Transcript_52519/g.111922 Transcript_52519/m.111922 type:complete len:259 (-) Transcript_52519:78-854(-)
MGGLFFSLRRSNYECHCCCSPGSGSTADATQVTAVAAHARAAAAAPEGVPQASRHGGHLQQGQQGSDGCRLAAGGPPLGNLLLSLSLRLSLNAAGLRGLLGCLESHFTLQMAAACCRTVDAIAAQTLSLQRLPEGCDGLCAILEHFQGGVATRKRPAGRAEALLLQGAGAGCRGGHHQLETLESRLAIHSGFSSNTRGEEVVRGSFVCAAAGATADAAALDLVLLNDLAAFFFCDGTPELRGGGIAGSTKRSQDDQDH